jgi:uncharacterized protein (TIGR03435 family)
MQIVNATTTVLMALAACHVVVAQSEPVAPTFEVVSIRRVAEPSEGPLPQLLRHVLRITPAGQLIGRADLKALIRLAYGAEPYERVVAAQSVASRSLDELFEIRAVPPQAASTPTREDMKAMTRNMLVERFGLEVRVDTELVSATVLQTIKPGVLGRGLRPAPEGCSQLPAGATPYGNKFAEAYLRSCMLTFFGDRLRGTMTLKDFALMLSVLARRPILDRTELRGMFAIDVAVASASLIPQPSARLGVAAEQSDAPAFVDAMRDQMGLSARRERQPFRLFVVEHVGPLVEN